MSRYRLSFMKPEKILSISRGEVTLPDLVKGKTVVPALNGLLCPRIFGTPKDHTCACVENPLKGKEYAGQICPRCKVEIESDLARRERVGHIVLPIPVINPVAFEYMGSIFGILSGDFERMVTKERHVDHFFGWQESSLGKMFLHDGKRVRCITGNTHSPETPYTTCQGVYDMVRQIDPVRTYEYLAEYGKKRKCFAVFKACIEAGFRLENLFIRTLPISPALHRPIFQKKGSNDFLIGDKNELYKKLVHQILRWHNLHEQYPYLAIVSLIKDNEAAVMQRSLNQILIRGFEDAMKHHFKSLTEDLSGKKGLNRDKLLGKRVDFSGRSVISPGPHMDIDQAGIPYKMAYNIFKVHILQKLREQGYTHKQVKFMWVEKHPAAYEALEELVKDHVVMLNRQPTLHRIGMLAFRVKLHWGHSILLHPMVCAPYNADFDGDQMALHIPLIPDTIDEMKRLMMPQRNMLSPLDSTPVIGLSHEMIIGVYFMTMVDEGEPKPVRRDQIELLMEFKQIKYTTPIKLYDKGTSRITTPGRLLIEELFQVPINEPLVNKNLKKLFSTSWNIIGPDALATAMNTLKNIAFEQATQAGFSIGMADVFVPSTKKSRFFNTEQYVEEQKVLLHEGAITDADYIERVTRRWFETIEKLQDEWFEEAGEANPLVVMLRTGARVKMSQVSQMVVAKGMQSKSNGSIIPTPVKPSLMEKVDTFGYFTTCYGARKSMADKKMATPKSGYLARRLVNAARDFYIVEEDCGYSGQGVELPENRVIGRVTCDGRLVEPNDRSELVKVRSPMFCRASKGICATCYGDDATTRRKVEIGSPVGVVAAQSLTEPCTQMTMRTFHTGGAAELGESPLAIRSAVSGFVSIREDEYFTHIFIEDAENIRRYIVHKNITNVYVSDGDVIDVGQVIATYVSQDLTNEDIGGKLDKLDAYYESRKPRGAEAIVAKLSGEVSLSTEDNLILVSIGGEYHGALSGTPLFIHDGEQVRIGQFLSYGEVAIDKLGSNLELVANVFVQRLTTLYDEEGVLGYPVHLEMLCRAMTEIVDNEGELGLYRFGDPGERVVKGVTLLGKEYPSWLKAMSFGYTRFVLANEALRQGETYDLPSERIMMGQFPLIDLPDTEVDITEDEVYNEYQD